jgi:glycosyltransferase involved in cell wall biosynthesis
MIYSMRSENEISGEKQTTSFLYNYLKSQYNVVSQDEYNSNKKQSFWSFLSISRYSKLMNISKTNLVDFLIIKIPTASQIFLVPLLTRKFKGKVIVWVDGLMWEFSGFKILLEFIRREPLILFSRMLINNKFLARFSGFFPLNFVVSSNTQKLQFFEYMHPNSSIHIIPNAVPYAEDFNNFSSLNESYKTSKEIQFGYIGHSYPVKGLVDIKKSFEYLYKKGISPKLEIAISNRGKLMNDMMISLPNTVYSGVINRAEFYSRIDCIILPYWADWGTNTIPSVILESLEYGVPLIISDSDLSRELFKEKNVFFFERKNYLELALIVEKIYFGELNLPESDSLKTLYLEHFSKEGILNKWDLLLGES